MSTYYCRICWNESGWTFPSGNTSRDGGYAGESRFGHEEWLFNFAWVVDGYHYAFLQPVNRAREKRAGESLNLVLWTINPAGERCEAGRIRNCRVLTLDEAQKAFAIHKKRGWYRQMQDDVEAVGGKTNQIDFEWLFNIRFRPEDASVIDPPIPFHVVPKEIEKYARYHLVKTQKADVQSLPSDYARDGSPNLPQDDPGNKLRQPARTVVFDWQEKRLQRRLMLLLREKFGKDNVKREGGFGPAPFDLVVRHGRRTFLIELKAYADARRAIREALGQVLEYTFFYPNRTEQIELFIVAPAPVTEAVSNYINILRTRFAIPIRYCPFTLGDGLPEMFVNFEANPV